MRLTARLTTGAANASPATHHTPEDVCETQLFAGLTKWGSGAERWPADERTALGAVELVPAASGRDRADAEICSSIAAAVGRLSVPDRLHCLARSRGRQARRRCRSPSPVRP